MISLQSNRSMILAVLLSATVGVLATGCKNCTNPSTDELAVHMPITTPSVSAVRSVQVEPNLTQRPREVINIAAADGTVTHGPLYFEDGFEDRDRGDGQFACGGEDYLGWFLGGGRFLVNLGFFPISAVVTPPWTLMTSDGEAERRAFGIEAHDAAR